MKNKGIAAFRELEKVAPTGQLTMYYKHMADQLELAEAEGANCTACGGTLIRWSKITETYDPVARDWTCGEEYESGVECPDCEKKYNESDFYEKFIG